MFYWIYDIPNWQLAAMISGGFVLIYWFGAILISPIMRRLVRSTSGSNDVVGYILSSFGVFYGLLLGLIAIAAHQNYTNVEDAVAREAIALSALNQESNAYPEPLGQKYLHFLSLDLYAVINLKSLNCTREYSLCKLKYHCTADLLTVLY